MEKLKRYLHLFRKEQDLRVQVIQTQSQDVEDERIRVALEREDLFLAMTDDEIAELNRLRKAENE